MILRERFTVSGILLLLTFMTLLRFVGLEKSPPGFYLDEAAISAQVTCLRQSGHDLQGEPWPLFAPVLGGGYATPPYLYAGVLWTSVFGDSIGSYRGFAALHGALAVVGLFVLALALFRSREVALWTALCAALSPWLFQFSRLAWDPALVPCYLVWGLALPLLPGRWLQARALAGGLLLALACYAYPPTRVQMALILPAFAIWFWFWRPEFRKSLVLSALVFAVSVIPLVGRLLTPEFQARAAVLSITSEDYLRPLGGFSWNTVLRLFAENLALNLSPSYLFWKGDANLRHAAGFWGQWSPLEIAALVLAAVLGVSRRGLGSRETLGLWVLCLWAYLAGVVPAALTWESNPHALRSLGAAPFLSLMAGVVLAKAKERWSWVPPFVLAGSAAFILMFTGRYFGSYPQVSRAWFDAEAVESQRFDEAYPELALKYFMLRRGEERCQ